MKIGAGGVPTYLYRGEAVNAAVKIAGNEVNMFKDRSEVRVQMDFDDLSDDELLIKLRDETDALIRARADRQARDRGEDELAPLWRSGRTGPK